MSGWQDGLVYLVYQTVVRQTQCSANKSEHVLHETAAYETPLPTAQWYEQSHQWDLFDIWTCMTTLFGLFLSGKTVNISHIWRSLSQWCYRQQLIDLQRVIKYVFTINWCVMCSIIYFLIQVLLGTKVLCTQSSTRPRVRTHDLQIVTAHFMSLRHLL